MLEAELAQPVVGFVTRLHRFPALQLALRLCRCGDDGLARHVKRVPDVLRAPCGAHPACWAVECECGQVVHAGQCPVACECGVWYVGDREAVYAIRLPETPDGE
jgi:hypothetical protein